MKTTFRITIILLLVVCCAEAMAQQSSSSSVVRRRQRDTERDNNATSAQVTERMQQFYQDTPSNEADAQWMKVVYRQLDLNDVKNAPLYYPEDVIDGQENMFRIIMRLLANNQIAAYEYLDGREIFTDQYRINVRDMLDRFHVLYSDAKGSTEKNPLFVIEESDVPTNEVLSYYLLERWELDKRTNRMRTKVEAVCPVLHRSGDFGGEAIKYPMFWVKMESLRPYLTQQSIFIDDDNNLAQYNYDDFFQLSLYEGTIYKTRNLRNKSMMQLYPDPDDLKRAQDSIQRHLDTFEDKMWVPTREELAAAREAAEIAGDTTSIASVDEEKSVKKSTKQPAKNKRAKKNKSPQIKESKVSKSSSATRSVRRRKN